MASSGSISGSAVLNVGANVGPALASVKQAVARIQGMSVNIGGKSSQPLGRITGQVAEFNKSLEAANARVVAFGASAGSVYLVERSIRALISTTIEVQKQLADINVLLNLSSSELQTFGSDLFSVARSTAQTFSTVATAAQEFSRQGLSMEETLKRTEAALILTRVSGMDAVKSVEALTSTVNAFASVGIQAVEVVNKLANVDAAFAVSSADLANALQRVGSSALDAGVSFDQLLAIVTTAQQITARGGSVIGNSLKTIFTRMQRGKTIDLLESLGVNTKDASGALKPTIDLLKDLANVYDTLGAIQKNYVAEQVGGVFQINILRAALGDLGKEYSIYERALQTSLGTTDEAIRRNDQLNKTIAALSAEASANIQEALSKIGNIAIEPQLGGFLEYFNSLFDKINNLDSEGPGAKIGTGLLKGLGSFISGPGVVLLGGIAANLFKKFSQFASGSFKELLGMNKATREREGIQSAILDILSKETGLNSKLLQGQISMNDAGAKLKQILADQYTILQKQQAVSAALAANMQKAGAAVGAVQMGGNVVAAVVPAGAKKTKASGFIPNFSGKMSGEMAEKIGAVNHGYSPGRVFKKRIHDGLGKSQLSHVNSAEDIIDFKNSLGKRATMVVPPNGFGDNTKIGSLASSGFIPNFSRPSGPISSTTIIPASYSVKALNAALTTQRSRGVLGQIANQRGANFEKNDLLSFNIRLNKIADSSEYSDFNSLEEASSKIRGNTSSSGKEGFKSLVERLNIEPAFKARLLNSKSHEHMAFKSLTSPDGSIRNSLVNNKIAAVDGVSIRFLNDAAQRALAITSREKNKKGIMAAASSESYNLFNSARSDDFSETKSGNKFLFLNESFNSSDRNLQKKVRHDDHFLNAVDKNLSVAGLSSGILGQFEEDEKSKKDNVVFDPFDIYIRDEYRDIKGLEFKTYKKKSREIAAEKKRLGRSSRRSTSGFVPNFAILPKTLGLHGSRSGVNPSNLSGTNLSGTSGKNYDHLVMSLLGSNFSLLEGSQENKSEAHGLATRATAGSTSSAGAFQQLNLNYGRVFEKEFKGRYAKMPYSNLTKAADNIFNKKGLTREWLRLKSLKSRTVYAPDEAEIFNLSQKLRQALQESFNRPGNVKGVIVDAPKEDVVPGSKLRYVADFGKDSPARQKYSPSSTYDLFSVPSWAGSPANSSFFNSVNSSSGGGFGTFKKWNSPEVVSQVDKLSRAYGSKPRLTISKTGLKKFPSINGGFENTASSGFIPNFSLGPLSSRIPGHLKTSKEQASWLRSQGMSPIEAAKTAANIARSGGSERQETVARSYTVSEKHAAGVSEGNKKKSSNRVKTSEFGRSALFSRDFSGQYAVLTPGGTGSAVTLNAPLSQLKGFSGYGIGQNYGVRVKLSKGSGKYKNFEGEAERTITPAIDNLASHFAGSPVQSKGINISKGQRANFFGQVFEAAVNTAFGAENIQEGAGFDLGSIPEKVSKVFGVPSGIPGDYKRSESGIPTSKSMINKIRNHNPAFNKDLMDFGNRVFKETGVSPKSKQGGAASGFIPNFARRIGYLDGDVLSDPKHSQIVKSEMEKYGISSTADYHKFLGMKVSEARASGALKRFSFIFGQPGAGKSTMMLGGKPGKGGSKVNPRIPILSPDDIKRVEEVIDTRASSTGTIAALQPGGYLNNVDRATVLSSTTKEEQEELMRRRQFRDSKGSDTLFGRRPGTSLSAGRDSSLVEAAIQDNIPGRGRFLGLRPGFKLARKDAPTIEEKKVGVMLGAMSPATKGHLSNLEEAKKYGISEKDFHFFVSREGGKIDPDDKHSWRTVLFDQKLRSRILKESLGGQANVHQAGGVNPKEAMSYIKTGERSFVKPGPGSVAFLGANDGKENSAEQYKKMGFGVNFGERTEGISGTALREAIFKGDMGLIRQLMTPSGASYVQSILPQLQARNDAMPQIIERVKAKLAPQLSKVESDLSAYPRVLSAKFKKENPEAAAKVLELRAIRDEIKKKLQTMPTRYMKKLGGLYPGRYGINTKSEGFIPNFAKNFGGDGGTVKDVMSLERNMSGSKPTLHMTPFPHIRNLTQPTFSSAMRDHGGLKSALADSARAQAGAGILSSGFIPNFSAGEEGPQGFDVAALIGSLQMVAMYFAFAGNGAKDLGEDFKNFDLSKVNDEINKSQQTVKNDEMRLQANRAQALNDQALKKAIALRNSNQANVNQQSAIVSATQAKITSLTAQQGSSTLTQGMQSPISKQLAILQSQLTVEQQNLDSAKAGLSASQKILKAKAQVYAEEAKGAMISKIKNQQELMDIQARKAAAAAYAKENTIGKKTGRFMKDRGFAIGMALQVIAAQASQFVNQDTKGGRGSAASINAFGSIAGMAGTGSMIAGPKGAAVFAAAGAVMEAPKVLKSFSDISPDLAKSSEEAATRLRNLSSSTQEVLSSFDSAISQDLLTLEGIEAFNKSMDSLSGKISSMAISDEKREELNNAVASGNFEEVRKISAQILEVGSIEAKQKENATAANEKLDSSFRAIWNWGQRDASKAFGLKDKNVQIAHASRLKLVDEKGEVNEDLLMDISESSNYFAQTRQKIDTGALNPFSEAFWEAERLAGGFSSVSEQKIATVLGNIQKYGAESEEVQGDDESRNIATALKVFAAREDISVRDAALMFENKINAFNGESSVSKARDFVSIMEGVLSSAVSGANPLQERAAENQEVKETLKKNLDKAEEERIGSLNELNASLSKFNNAVKYITDKINNAQINRIREQGSFERKQIGESSNADSRKSQFEIAEMFSREAGGFAGPVSKYETASKLFEIDFGASQELQRSEFDLRDSAGEDIRNFISGVFQKQQKEKEKVEDPDSKIPKEEIEKRKKEVAEQQKKINAFADSIGNSGGFGTTSTANSPEQMLQVIEQMKGAFGDLDSEQVSELNNIEQSIKEGIAKNQEGQKRIALEVAAQKRAFAFEKLKSILQDNLNRSQQAGGGFGAFVDGAMPSAEQIVTGVLQIRAAKGMKDSFESENVEGRGKANMILGANQTMGGAFLTGDNPLIGEVAKANETQLLMQFKDTEAVLRSELGDRAADEFRAQAIKQGGGTTLEESVSNMAYIQTAKGLGTVTESEASKKLNQDYQNAALKQLNEVDPELAKYLGGSTMLSNDPVVNAINTQTAQLVGVLSKLSFSPNTSSGSGPSVGASSATDNPYSSYGGGGNFSSGFSLNSGVDSFSLPFGEQRSMFSNASSASFPTVPQTIPTKPKETKDPFIDKAYRDIAEEMAYEKEMKAYQQAKDEKQTVTTDLMTGVSTLTKKTKNGDIRVDGVDPNDERYRYAEKVNPFAKEPILPPQERLFGNINAERDRLFGEFKQADAAFSTVERHEFPSSSKPDNKPFEKTMLDSTPGSGISLVSNTSSLGGIRLGENPPSLGLDRLGSGDIRLGENPPRIGGAAFAENAPNIRSQTIPTKPKETKDPFIDKAYRDIAEEMAYEKEMKAYQQAKDEKQTVTTDLMTGVSTLTKKTKNGDIRVDGVDPNDERYRYAEKVNPFAKEPILPPQERLFGNINAERDRLFGEFKQADAASSGLAVSQQATAAATSATPTVSPFLPYQSNFSSLSSLSSANANFGGLGQNLISAQGGNLTGTALPSFSQSKVTDSKSGIDLQAESIYSPIVAAISELSAKIEAIPSSIKDALGQTGDTGSYGKSESGSQGSSGETSLDMNVNFSANITAEIEGIEAQMDGELESFKAQVMEKLARLQSAIYRSNPGVAAQTGLTPGQL